MPDIKTDDGCTIHAEIEGPDNAPVLMLSNSLGTNLHMWDDQVAPFTKHFRLLRYDRRGHGQSSVPKGPYTMERLGRDVLAVLDGLGIAKINWCGLSMGGMVGQWLGANAGNRVNKLILSNTSSYFPDKAMWNGRLQMVREKGLAGIVDANMERWFTKGFRERAPQDMKKMHDMFVATKLDGYIGCGEAVRDMDHRPLLPKIAAPTSGHRRQARSGDAARRQRIYSEEHCRRQACRARCGAHCQCRTAAGLYGYGAWVFVKLIFKSGSAPSHAAALKRERYRLSAAVFALTALLARLVLTALLLLAGLVLATLLLLTGLALSALLLAGFILSALLRIALIILFVCHRDVLRCEPPPNDDNPPDPSGFLGSSRCCQPTP